MKTATELDTGQRAFVRDLRDSRRALADAARYARDNRAQINAEWDALPDVPRTIAAHLAGGIDPKLAAEWDADCPSCEGTGRCHNNGEMESPMWVPCDCGDASQ